MPRPLGVSAEMKTLVTGATGYVGSRLARRLLRDHHEVRGLTRQSSASVPGVELVMGDAVSGEGLERALDGVQVAYYLIHSMEPSPDGAFMERERRSAENFAGAADALGVERIVYLGGLIPEGGPASDHLASRLEVENVLLGSSACSVALRASIVIGAGSRSFRFLVKLVERMPVLAIPAWRSNRTNPVDERDVIEMLARAATADDVCGRSFDVGGPDTVSYEQLIQLIRDHMLLARPTVALGSLNPHPDRQPHLGPDHRRTSRADRPADGEPRRRPARSGASASEAFGVRLHSLDSAIEHALREWEADEPLAAR